MANLKNATNKFKVKKTQTNFTNNSQIINKKKIALPYVSVQNKEQIQNETNLLIKNKVSDLALSEKFMNLLMIDGKKIKAYNLFYESLRFLEAKTSLNSLKLSKQFLAPTSPNFVSSAKQVKGAIFVRNLLFEAIENIKPSVEVRKVRKGGITYQVPALISKQRQETLAIRWIIDAAKNRKKNSKMSFAECLALELTEASKKLGKPRQKRDELHKLAESNRAYIRFRWW